MLGHAFRQVNEFTTRIHNYSEPAFRCGRLQRLRLIFAAPKASKGAPDVTVVNVVKVARRSDKRFGKRIRVWSTRRTPRFSFVGEQRDPGETSPMQVSGRL